TCALPISLCFVRFRHDGLAEDAAFEVIHDVEGSADDAVVLAERIHARYGDARVFECLHDAVFAVDLVRAGEELPRGLLAHHIALAAARARRGQQEGGVRLAAFELAYFEIAAEAFDRLPAIGFETLHIEAMRLAD